MAPAATSSGASMQMGKQTLLLAVSLSCPLRLSGCCTPSPAGSGGARCIGACVLPAGSSAHHGCWTVRASIQPGFGRNARQWAQVVYVLAAP